MKRFLYLISFIITSCEQPGDPGQKQSVVDATDTSGFHKNPIENKAIIFKGVEGNAILIGDNIEILDSNFLKVMNLKEGAVVSLTGASDSLIRITDDYCDAFHFVKIKTSSGDRIIDGRNVYRISGSKQDTSFQYKNKRFDIIKTSFFGIGVSNNDGLTFCDKYYEPIVLVDKEFNNPKLIEIVKNDVFKKASWNHEFKYFELMANDGAYDKIQKVEQIENGIIITIKREFQEGWNEFQVKLYLNDENYKVEYLNYGEIKY